MDKFQKAFFLGYMSQSKSGAVFGRLNVESVMGKCGFIRGKPGNTRNDPLFEPETHSLPLKINN